jgi:SAM-dependent MidA family methyltransferase
LEDISKVLLKGFLLTIDYGDIADRLYTERRKEGTLVCYHSHQVKGNPFVLLGEQDITAHVNFSALQHWGNKFGFKTIGFTNQSDFLLGLGFKDHLLRQISSGEDPVLAAFRASRIANMLLIEMGEKFKVLVQSKHIGPVELRALQVN